jgi:hypothetical protein
LRETGLAEEKNTTRLRHSVKSYYQVVSANLRAALGIFLLVWFSQTGFCQTAKPEIDTVNGGQPDDTTNVIGNQFIFVVGLTPATDVGVTYQWRKSNINISGATNFSYSKDVSVASDAGTYNVLCSNSLGTTLSSNALLTIWYPPIITNMPRSNAVVAGSNVHFSVRVDQTKIPTNFTYQWYRSTFFVGDDGVSVSGSATADLWLTNVDAADSGDYTCDIVNSAGTSSTTNATLNVVFPPTLTVDGQPDPLTVLDGDSASFIVLPDPSTTDTADFPLTYQWRKNGVNLAGETSFSYQIGTATTADAADYTCVLKNWAGSTTSIVAHLTVYVPLVITADPVSALLPFSSTPHVMSVTATGTAPISYQWRTNYTDIPNATNATYSFIPSSTNQSAIYDCNLSNIVNTANSADAIITVRSEIIAPSLTQFSPSYSVYTVTTNSSVNVTIRASDAGSGLAYVRSQNQTAGTNWVTCTNSPPGGLNWLATLTLLPGTNILQADAQDVAGNNAVLDATSMATVFYSVPTPFVLLMNGNYGVVNTTASWPAPNQKAALSNYTTLAYGLSYTMTSAPASGYRFVNWSGSVNSTNPVLTFLVQSNQVITANFGETNLPTLAITNPAASGRFTNTGSLTLGGTANDLGNGGIPGQLAAIKWQLNTGAWNTAAGTNPWVALTAPLVGSNIFRAYAIDTSSNFSTTNTFIFTNVTVGTLTVLTNGRGTVTNSLNGQTLFVSSNYTMTATAYTNLGFVFTNWTGGTNGTLTVFSNGPILNFTMKSNLTLQANFKDIVNPTLTITNTLPAGVVTNMTFTVLGTATDNDVVAAVKYQLNTAAWATATGTNNWLANLTLATGSNIFRAYAVDAWGNKSTTNTLTAVNTLLTPITITFTFTNNTARAAFPTIVGATYYLEAKGLPATNLTWITLPGSASGNGAQIILTDTNAPATNRFYRVRTTVP